MGYYDEPETIDTTVSFTCSECDYENENIDVCVYKTEDVADDVECVTCGHYNKVSLVTEQCSCGDHCRC
jgi:hypothetical protein